MKLTSKEALKLLEQQKFNTKDNRWIEHCISVGNSAGRIANALLEKGIKIDVDKTIILGYLHDIGKYNGESHGHVMRGYKFLEEKGYGEEYCNICLTHSYLNNDVYCTAGGVPRDIPFRTEFIKNHKFTIYEKIINLCDLMCTSVNLTLEKRLIDIMKRRGVHENTVYHINEAQKLKKEFDDMLGFNVYDLFPDIINN